MTSLSFDFSSILRHSRIDCCLKSKLTLKDFRELHPWSILSQDCVDFLPKQYGLLPDANTHILLHCLSGIVL